MKIWIFICGVLVCSLLFFTSGTLVGYSACEKKIKEAAAEGSRPKRKPSVVEKIAKPLIGMYVDRQSVALRGKVRMPSSPAIEKARMYKSVVDRG